MLRRAASPKRRWICAALPRELRAALPAGAMPDFLLPVCADPRQGEFKCIFAPADYAFAIVLFRELLLLAGVPRACVLAYTLHSCRHTFVSWGAQLGLHWCDLQDLGHWKDIRMPKAYPSESITIPAEYPQ